MGKLKKIPAWQLTKVRNKNEVIEEARNKCRKLHFASLMDLCHLKNSELEPQYPKYKSRVVLQGDIVKDDSGSYAVFTEQGSSVSQLTAAEVMDMYQGFQDVRDKQLIKVRVQAQMAQIMVQYGRPSRSSRIESIWSSSGRASLGKAI